MAKLDCRLAIEFESWSQLSLGKLIDQGLNLDLNHDQNRLFILILGIQINRLNKID